MTWQFRITLLGALLAGALPASAQITVTLSPAERSAAIESIVQIVDDEFYDAARAHEIAEAVRDEARAGAFDEATTSTDLATALTLRLSAEDHHFSVRYIGPEGVAEATQPQGGGQGQNRPDPLRGMQRGNFGFAEVSILPGNIGYIDMRAFAPIQPARETATAALAFVANTDAVIFDMRRNHGGAPSMVQFLVSHFLPATPETVINRFFSRDFETPQEMVSLADHPAGHRPDVPLVVLTSGNTGSAGEAFPYHLQAMQRATIIGETTAGAGNPGGTYFTDEGYALFVSTSSARNPITGTNWEGVGVVPDIQVPADTALDEALMRLYGQLAAAGTDEQEVADLNWALDTLRARQEPIELSGDELARYAGIYGNRIIELAGDHLTYFRAGGSPQALLPIGQDRFALPGEESYQFTFTVDSDGPASALMMHVSGGPTELNSRSR